MRSTEFSITEDGNLRINLTSQGQTDLERLLKQHPDWNEADIFMELIDSQLASGWYVISPTQIRARTLSLILTNSVTYDDHGNIVHIADAYWYPEFERASYAKTLIDEGHLIFLRADWSTMA